MAVIEEGKIREAVGYLRSVSEGCNNQPGYQQAIAVAIEAMENYIGIKREVLVATEKSLEDTCAKYRELRSIIGRKDLEIGNLKAELNNERYRHDRMRDYSADQDVLIDQLRADVKACGDIFDRIPRCETCGYQKCPRRPGLGEYSVFNCPFWTSKDGESNA